MQFSVNIDQAALKNAAETVASELAHRIASRHVEKHFANGQQWGVPRGDGYKQIEQILKSKENSEDVGARVVAIIEECWDKALEEATRAAVERKARKIANAAVKDK